MASGWLRRDWQKCGDPTQITFSDGTIAFESRSSSALVWQVPTPNGPFAIDPTLDWVRQCNRPPIAFFRSPRGRPRHGHAPDLADKDVHEIAYVWARSLPLGTALYQETTVIPLVFKARAARLVVETGEVGERGSRRSTTSARTSRGSFQASRRVACCAST